MRVEARVCERVQPKESRVDECARVAHGHPADEGHEARALGCANLRPRAEEWILGKGEGVEREQFE